MDVIYRTNGAARDFRDAALAQGIHKIVDNAVFQGVLLAGALHLQEQTFAQVPRPDARRFEGLNDL